MRQIDHAHHAEDHGETTCGKHQKRERIAALIDESEQRAKKIHSLASV
jgi:hypothetical protein